MCSIIIVGALVTITGCHQPAKAETAERTTAVAAVLTKWEPAPKVQPNINHVPTRYIVEKRPAPVVAPSSQTINVHVAAQAGPWDWCANSWSGCIYNPPPVKPTGPIKVIRK